MIPNMYWLYKSSNQPTELRLCHTSQNDIPYWQGTCPNCRQETLAIFDNTASAYCHNAYCGSKFSMFSFCKDVLGYEGDEMVKFILGKQDLVNEFDYRDFAKIVHRNIFREEEGKSEISYHLPEDREAIKPCSVCGGTQFVYRITKSNVTPYCLYCGQWLPVPRKKKNVNKTRRDNACGVWSKRVYVRYGGRCALCGSTDRCEAHHIVPYSVCPEHAHNIDNGILLCKFHHDLIHTNPIYIHQKAPACAGASKSDAMPRH